MRATTLANSAERRHPGEGFIPAEHVGTLLQETRLRLGQDLRIIADDLRIKYHHLLAIEDGRFDDLPGPTYVTGFIRAYAEHLGLDAEEIVRRYKNEPQGAVGTGALDFPTSSRGGGMPGGALLLILLVVVAASYGVWYWMSVSKTSLADLLPSLPPPLVAMIYGPDAAGGSDATGHDTPDVEVASDETETGAGEDTADETPEPAPPETETPNSDGLAALNPTPAPSPEAPAPTEATDAPDAAEPSISATITDADEATSEPQPQTGMDAPETAEAELQTEAEAETETEADPGTGAADAPQATTDGNTAPTSDGAEIALADEDQGGESAEPTEAETVAEADSAPEPTDDAVSSTPDEGTAPDGEHAASSAPAIPETSPEAETEAETETETAAAETESEAEPTAEPEPEPEPEETAEAEEEPEEASPAYVGRPAPSDVQAVAGDSRIVLRANRDSWIQVRRAGELVVRRLLRRGDTYAVPGGVGYTLNTSNAGGLEVYIDGRRAPNLGPVGAARNGIILSPGRLN
jgi:cytoskeletal protein RodZ